MKTACILLANGFEEIEAIAVLDILRRTKIEVTLAGLDHSLITSARGLRVTCDCVLSDIQTTLFDALVLPGGEPGTTHLEQSETVKTMILNHLHHQKWLAAICAAPRILNDLNLLQGKKATSFPGTKPRMTQCQYLEDSVVIDSSIITSRGAGTALEFGYALVEILTDQNTADQLKQTMVFKN